MTAGPVNRALLESFFQNPGDIYDDAKSEACLDVLADQIDENWADYSGTKSTLQSTTPGSSGSQYVKSAPITGVTGTSVYEQLAFIENQILSLVESAVPPGSITTAMLQDQAVTLIKLASSIYSAAAVASTLMQRDINGRSQVAVPAVGADIARFDTVTGYIPVSGTYTGNGTSTRTITLPFTPDAVLLMKAFSGGSISYSSNDSGLAVTGSPITNNIGNVASVGTNAFDINDLSANVSGHKYNYIAFRKVV